MRTALLALFCLFVLAGADVFSTVSSDLAVFNVEFTISDYKRST
jgi:hypothetical protein